MIASIEAARVAQGVSHYGLHFVAPGIIAWLLFRARWRRAWLIMVATMLVDLDHVLAYPQIFVPDRCSVGFHPLHSGWAIAAYLVGAAIPATRVPSVGLLFHMVTDAVDCVWMAALEVY